MNRHASMNRIYRLLWSEALQAFVPAAETARGRGKRAKRRLLATALALASGAATAGPTGGQVTGGSATVTQSGATTTIVQASQNLAMNWQSFNIAPQETVDFVQPNAASIAVNRIFDPNGSAIWGHLNANGQVYLINPNGVLFGPGAEVNVGGLIASALDLNDGASSAGSKVFSGAGAGSIVNEGTLTAANGGAIALLGNHVANTGVIAAQLGTVALGAGSAATLTFQGTKLVSLQIERSVLDSVAANGGLIRADGGAVLMSAGAQKSLLASVVNNSGIIEARTLENHEGTITLLGGMTAGTVNVGGTLDASAPEGGHGGVIDTSAAQVHIAGSAKVTTAAALGLTGTWTIDPDGFTIAASGGDMTGASLSAALAASDVTIQSTNGSGSDGNVNVNDAVSWTANKLTLTATNDVNINAVMTAAGTASLDLAPGSNNVNVGMNADGTFKGRLDFSGSGTLRMNVGGTLQTFTVIEGLGTAADAVNAPANATLQGIAAPANLGGYFALGANIDASSTVNWNACSTCNNGSAGHYGFTPIGNSAAPFTGVFDGLGHTISGVTINQYAGGQVGLFGQLGGFSQPGSPQTIRNVGLLGGIVTAGSPSGGSVGTITYAGSLVGVSYGVVRNSFTSAAVSGYTVNNFPYLTVGGLIGASYGLVLGSHASGNVFNNETTYGGTGGLVGSNSYQGSIQRSYATGSVTGVDGSVELGGLVGTSGFSTISNSYATGSVSAGANSTNLGGLAGNGSTIISSYATGNVTGGDGSYRLGGLVGASTATVYTSFASGTVTVNGSTGGGGNADLGGLVGAGYGNVNNSYATGNIVVTGIAGAGHIGGLVGYLSAATVANSYATGSLAAAGIGASGGLVGGLANGASTTGSFWNTTTSGATASAAGVGLSTAQIQTQANFTTATPANGNANPSWDFGGTWTMYEGHTAPLLQAFMTPLVVSGTIAQTYDGAAFAPTVSNLTYSSNPDFSHILGTVTVTGNALGALHAGTYTYTPGGLYSDQLGYILSFSPSTLTIQPAALTVVGSTASKVYDGTTAAPLTGGTLVGVLGSDSVSLTQNGSFATKNVGTGIAVTATDTLGGAAAGDYTLIEPTGLTGTITPAPLTVSGTTVGSKVYNGTTAASLTNGSLVGLIGGDAVSLTQAGAFASKNAGTGIAVTATDTLGGAAAGDYTLIEPTGLTGTITPAPLTVSGTVVGSKVYNGSAAAPLTGGTLLGVVSGDSVSLNQSGTFASSAAGTNLAVTATDTLSGTSATDYSLIEPIGLVGSILPAPTPLPPAASNDLLSAALNARTQIVDNFLYPQWGANPQVINPASTIAVISAAPDGAGAAASDAHEAITVNVSMKIGATGTLKIENGGLRLPTNLVIGNE